MSKNFVFDTVPTIRRQRTRLDLSYGVKTSANVGDLVPIMLHEVLPGDTSVNVTNIITRTTTALKTPIMDNLFLDTMYFYIPNRLLMDDWESVICGKQLPYNQPDEVYSIPNVLQTGSKIVSGSLADYLGIPLSDGIKDGVFASVLPFRAYALVWNEWFRDENLQSPKNIIKSANDSPNEVIGVDNPVDWSDDVNKYTNVKLAKVAKLHDYFTSALPQPQKGPSVTLPTLGEAQVYAGDPHDHTSDYMSFDTTNLPTFNGSSGVGNLGTPLYVGANVPSTWSQNYVGKIFANKSTTSGSVPESSAGGLYPNNLYADLKTATTANVNDLRLSFALQRMLERDARGGSRYIETIKSAYGVDAGDYRLQRPEYLGGSRNPIRISQVNDTTNLDNQLGQVGAYSLSAGRARFSKSFVEHGWILGVACIRQFHTYQQGLNKMWTRKSRLDFYDPALAYLGEQPIMQTELYLNTDNPEQIFGYQMAHASYRYTPNIVTGQMRSDSPISFDVWHLADNYGNAPVLTESFITETSMYLDRVLQAPTTVGSNQFILDIWNAHNCTRVMPFDPIPGLIDHN